jgi:hypothetical protein
MPAGKVTSSKSVTVKNTGLSDLQINSIDISGTNTGDFSQTNDCGTVVKGGSCTITVVFEPQAANIHRTANLVISSNDPQKSNATLKLSGALALSRNGETTSVSGTVSYNNVPLPGVTIVAYNTNNNTVRGTATTDSNGHYSFRGLNTSCTMNCVQVYNFIAFKDGYAFNPVLAGNPTSLQWNGHVWNALTGGATVRADYTGAFTNPDNNTGAPIHFNVFAYTSVIGASTTGANFLGYNGSNPLVHLAATGQHTSYAPGDDAALQAGVPWPTTRFIDNGDGTVTDNLTGLVWLKDAGCLAPATWSGAISGVNQLANGQCGLADGSRAGQWRLPNLIEMESMIDASASSPAVSGPFTNVSNDAYWTSSVYWSGSEGTTNAWAIRFSDGRYINGNNAYGNNEMAIANNYVWAVRGTSNGAVTLQATGEIAPFAPNDDGTLAMGAPLPSSRMIDNGNGTVTDTVTGLIWLKQANCINNTWQNALADISQLASGQCGLSDGSKPGQWRMPNRREMLSLQDRGQNNHALYFNETFSSGSPGIPTQNATFNSMIASQYYWTSTTNASDPTEAWTVFSCDFGLYDTPKGNTGYSLAVR